MRAPCSVLAAVLAGCLSSSAVPCGDHVCPADSRCHEESGLCIPAGCGDGVVGGIEECDGDNLGGRDCTTFGYYDAPGLACSPVCTLVESGCAGVCGDHVIAGGEYCDGAPLSSESCIDYGFDLGRMSCTSACSPGFDTCRQVGWSVVGGDQLIPLNAIWGASATDMFAVGEQGRIWRGDGSTWSIMTTPETVTLNGVWGTSAGDVFAIGDGGVILHFDGTAWSRMTSANPDDLYAVWGRGPNEVYAVGADDTILQFDGSTWAQVTADLMQTGPTLRGIYGNATRVIAVGDNTAGGRPRLWRKDATAAWAADSTAAAVTELPDGYDLNAVWAVGDEFFAVGGEALNGLSVVARFNGTWSAAVTGTRTTLVSVWGTSATNIVAGGHSGLLLRFDGQAWRQAQIDTMRTVTGLWGSNSDRMFGSTLAGTILGMDGYEWIYVDGVGDVTRNFDDVWRYPGGEMIVVGSDGTLLIARNGTVTAAPLNVTSTQDLQGIWSTPGAYGSGETFVTSRFSGVFRRQGEGTFDNTLRPTGNFQDVWGTSATNVYAVGGTNTFPRIDRFNGSGWTSTFFPAGPRFLDVWGSGPNDVFVVGEEATLLHSTDGTSWTPMTHDVDPVYALRSVWGSGSDDVYAVGGSGTVIHYDGTSWKRPSLKTSETFTRVFGTSAHDVFIAGTGGLWHYDGVSWSRMAPPRPISVLGASGGASAVTFSGPLGNIVELRHACSTTEVICGDPWDNDCDGMINCADPDCGTSAECATGGACVVTADLGCNESRAGTSFTGIARLDEWRCLLHATTGTEVTYRFVAPASGEATIALENVAGDADLIVLDASSNAAACSTRTCTAATEDSITIPASGQTVYVVVDAAAGRGADFTITTTCN